MIVLYILAGLIGFVLLLLCLPVRVEIKYSEQLSLKIRYLFIPFSIFPQKEKTDRKENRFTAKIKELWDAHFSEYFSNIRKMMLKRKKAFRYRMKQLKHWFREKLGIKEKQKPAAAAPAQQKSSFAQLREARGFSGMIALIWRLLSIAGGSFGRIFRGITVKKFDFIAKVGGEDAAQTAVNYGKWCSVLYPALSFILGSVRRYNSKIDISPDFANGNSAVDADIVLYIMPVSVAAHGIGGIVKLIFLEIKDAIKQKMNAASQQAAQNI